MWNWDSRSVSVANFSRSASHLSRSVKTWVLFSHFQLKRKWSDTEFYQKSRNFVIQSHVAVPSGSYDG